MKETPKHATFTSEETREVLAHLGALNSILDEPDLTLVDVVFTIEETLRTFRLRDSAAGRVSEKFGWLVVHQMPKIGRAKTPSPATVPGPRAIPPKARAAAVFFHIPFPPEPMSPRDVEAQTIPRREP